jgi:hypothetical protein
MADMLFRMKLHARLTGGFFDPRSELHGRYCFDEVIGKRLRVGCSRRDGHLGYIEDRSSGLRRA